MLDGGVFRELSPACLQGCFVDRGHDVVECLGGSRTLIAGGSDVIRQRRTRVGGGGVVTDGLDLPTVTPGVMKEVGEVEVSPIHYIHDLLKEIAVIWDLSVLLISLPLRTRVLNCTFSSQWDGTPLRPLVSILNQEKSMYGNFKTSN